MGRQKKIYFVKLFDEENSWLHPSQLYKPKAEGLMFYDLFIIVWPLLYTEKNLATNPPVCVA